MSHAQLVLMAVGLLLIVGPGYYVACMLWPFTNCRKCKGSGRRRSPSGKNFGRCRRCKGRGERLRTGRKVINWLSSAKNDAS